MAKPPNKVLLAGAGALVLLVVLAVGAFTVGPFGGGGIHQPIAFPHDVHAGTNQIPCMYCHTSADRSTAAGIPSMQVCAGCHIPGGVTMIAADSTGVKQLEAYWREQKPIPWVRIHNLPDHASFPHMRHVNAGVECQECHGPVETMVEVEQFSSLRMGWCIECHREREVRVDCFVCHY
ncbi:MAG: cytochrome c3 family protein [Gemmatimonadetes bacterium]|nr:cytochrome c3 family protein [Gemmatimonadota bacterium]